MQYVILADEREWAVDVEADPFTGDHTYAVTLGDEQLSVEAVFLPDGAVSLLVDGEHFLVRVDEAGALLRGHYVPAEILSLRRLALRRASEQIQVADGPTQISAPMAGRVARVLVHEGQRVEAGQGLVVLEAMKMENELRAPKTGVVSALSCRPEALVELGSPLCRVE